MKEKRSWIQIQTQKKKETEASEFACDLLKSLGKMAEPIDPFDIAALEYPDLKVATGDFRESFDGRIEYHPERNRFLIFVNTKYNGFPESAHHPRVRFSLAHELGHFYLDEHRRRLMQGQGTHTSRAEFQSQDLVEREADAFAAGLLMPAPLFKRHVHEAELSAERIRQIANRFQASPVSVAIRSVELSDRPCEVVGVRGGAVAWRFRSASVAEAKCYPLALGPLKSPAARRQWERFEAGDDVADSAAASPVDWYRMYGPAQREFHVSEHYLPVPSMKTLIVLLTVPEELIASEEEDSYGDSEGD